MREVLTRNWDIIAAFLAVMVAVILIKARFWPYGRCPSCYGRKGRGLGSTAKAFNRCRKCGGTGERIRPLAKIYPRWREEARRQRHEW